jgi:D-beta-D-heptose 7-phosphate kinase/D-beta-D-heptose 1-phosphate adenosyltransferase
MRVVWAIKGVDQVFLAVDKDWSVCESIRTLHKKAVEKYGNEVQFIFGKGGDRFVWNIPEVAVCQEFEIEIRDGLGIKNHSSSDYRTKT